MRPIATALDTPHLTSFTDLVKARFDALEVDALLVYLIDTVSEDALYYLAEQFDVLGFKGWALTTTVAERRALIKRAIELEKFKGTPYAVKEAMRTIGFDNVVIEERLSESFLYYDGEAIYDGTWTHGSGHWAMFRVILDIASFGGVLDQARLNLAIELINEYKPVRCWLVEVNYGVFVDEQVTVTDEVALEIEYLINDDVSIGLIYDGSAEFNGDNAFDDGDQVQVQVI